MNVEIVKAQPEDAEAWCEVRKLSWLDTYPNEEYGITREDILSKEFDTPEKIAKWRESMANPNDYVYFSAKVDGKVVGLSTGRAAKLEDELNEVCAIYLLPEFQRQGIGSKLMQATLDTFDLTIPTVINAVVYNQKAISFYEKFGFKKNKLLPEDQGKLPNGKLLPEVELIRE